MPASCASLVSFSSSARRRLPTRTESYPSLAMAMSPLLKRKRPFSCSRPSSATRASIAPAPVSLIESSPLSAEPSSA